MDMFHHEATHLLLIHHADLKIIKLDATTVVNSTMYKLTVGSTTNCRVATADASGTKAAYVNITPHRITAKKL